VSCYSLCLVGNALASICITHAAQNLLSTVAQRQTKLASHPARNPSASTGVKSLIKLPLTPWYSSSSTSGTSITSHLSSLPQPAVAFEDLQQLPKPEALILTKQLRDDDRVLEGLVPAPAGTLLVAPDNLGRVLLLDGASMAAVRIWKVGSSCQPIPLCMQCM
jgi:hypothetical protein